jgi:hypothetical protein
MANLIDHYLLQLKSYLPAKQREDIAAELRESIRSAVEERERELGRGLTDEELSAVLKGYGHPLLIAGQYLPMQQLIGPTVFPVYWYALQAVLIVFAVIGGIVGGIALLTATRPAQAALQVFADVFWIALLAAAVITFVFAVIDNQRVRFKFFGAFEPRELETGILGVRSAPLSPIGRRDTIFELATVAILLMWWVGWLDFRNVLPSGVATEFSAAIEPFFLPVLALCAIELVRLSVDLTRPYRTPLRTVWRLSANGVWLLLFVLLFRADGLLQVMPGVVDTGEAVRVVALMELAFRIALFVLATVTGGLIATDLVRLLRR